MIIAAVITGAATGFVIICGLAILISVWKRRITSVISQFIVQPDEKTASRLAILVDQAAFIFASRLVLQLKTTVMGMNSVDSKNERRAETAAALSSNPGLAALLKFLPGASRLAKHPELFSLVGGLVSKLASKNGRAPAASDSVQAIFPL